MALKNNYYMTNKKIFIFLAFIFIILNPVLSQNNINKYGNIYFATPFLTINPDARSGAMGNANIASDPDINDVFNNFSKVNRLEDVRNISFNYTPYFQSLGYNDIYLTNIGYAQKINNNSSWIVGLRFFSYGSIHITDITGVERSVFNPNDLSLDAGYAISISNSLDLGVSFRFINSSLYKGDVLNSGVVYKDGNTLAANISLFYQQDRINNAGFKAGLYIANLGGKIGYTNNVNDRDFIPATLGLGVAYKYKIDEDNAIDINTDIVKLLVPATPVNTSDAVALAAYRNTDVLSSYSQSFGGSTNINQTIKYNFGASYTYRDFLSIKAGYVNQYEGNFYTTGLGLKYNNINLHFAYATNYNSNFNRSPLANTLRFGVGFGF